MLVAAASAGDERSESATPEPLPGELDAVEACFVAARRTTTKLAPPADLDKSTVRCRTDRADIGHKA